MQRRNLYDNEAHREILDRIGKLGPDLRPSWGVMSPAQMCAHCAEVLEVAEGKALEGTPWFVRPFGGLIKKLVLSDRPYPRGARTHPQYVFADLVNFASGRDRLVAAVNALFEAGRESAGLAPHPLFGRMTAEEKGWGMYKHLDHHLRQFGV
jgi:Protein of unknown function (DUF1569)